MKKALTLAASFALSGAASARHFNGQIDSKAAVKEMVAAAGS
jgi:hypothetical protein